MIKNLFKTKIIIASLFLVSFLILLGGSVIVLAQVGGFCGIADPVGDTINCDHYLSYLIDKTINPINVVLHDQFMGPVDFKLVLIERLLNPVKKIHAGLAFEPQRPDLHYLAYRVKTEAPFEGHPVLVENQFERQIVFPIKPRYLLVPTGKNKIGAPIEKILEAVPPAVADKLIEKIVPPIPKNANHYLCYDIEPYEISTSIAAKDQFQRRSFKVVRAKYLCNPVVKAHDDKVSEIVDENTHLMCYEVVPHNKVNRKVITHDQFGVKSQNTIQTEEVCVPSIKSDAPKVPPEET